MTATSRHALVVVGVDGSATAAPALRWAIREARPDAYRSALVSAWNPSYDIDTLGLATRVVEDHCRAILGAATGGHRRGRPEHRGDAEDVHRPAITALIEESGHADTVVGIPTPPHPSGVPAGSHVVGGRRARRLPRRRRPRAGRCTLGKGRRGRRRDAAVERAVAYAFAYASAHDVSLTVLHAFQVEYVEVSYRACQPTSREPGWPRRNWP